MKTLTQKAQKADIRPEDTSHAALIHLSALSSYIGMPMGSILGPLIFWLIWRDQSSFIDEHGKEALNFNISILLYQILIVLIGIIMFIGSLTGVAVTEGENLLPLLLTLPGVWLLAGGLGLLAIVRLVLIIVAAVKAGNGEIYHYPLSLRLIK